MIFFDDGHLNQCALSQVDFMKDQVLQIFLGNISKPAKLEHLFSLENIERVEIPETTLEEVKNIFYSFIKSEEEYLKLFQDSSAIVLIAKKFGPFIQGIFELPIDQAYLERCFNVGYAHHKIKLEPYGFTLGLWKIAEHLKKIDTLPTFADNIIHLVNFLVNSAYSSCKQYEDEKNAQQFKILLRSILHDLSGPLSALEFRYENLLREFELFGSSLDFSYKILEDAKNAVIALDQKGKLSEAKTDCLELNRLVEQIVDLNSVKIKEKDLSIKLSNKDISQIEIKTNSYKFTQAISNFLSNAIKFTEKYGEINIILEKIGSDLKISIADTGVGIAEDDMSSIFDIKLGAPTPGTEGEKGSGYGLPIAKKFLDILGYNFSIESIKKTSDSEKKHGTKISVVIPSEDIVSIS